MDSKKIDCLARLALGFNMPRDMKLEFAALLATTSRIRAAEFFLEKMGNGKIAESVDLQVEDKIYNLSLVKTKKGEVSVVRKFVRLSDRGIEKERAKKMRKINLEIRRRNQAFHELYMLRIRLEQNPNDVSLQNQVEIAEKTYQQLCKQTNQPPPALVGI